MVSQRLNVEVQDDFIERQSKASPLRALSELVWNALDGEATKVRIELHRSDLAGGISQIIVQDNGTGFSHDDAVQYFQSLGGSWKRQTRATPNLKRQIHGQEGRGRYKALALGEVAIWNVCFQDEDGTVKSFAIKMDADDYASIELSDPVLTPGQPTGVQVEIDNMRSSLPSLGNDESAQELTELFATYLINYKDVKIEFDGTALDPETAILDEREFKLSPIVDVTGATHDALLHIVEWRRKTKCTLYLCTEEGFPLDQVAAKFQVGGYWFSAYLKSPYITQLHKASQLGLAEMDGALQSAVSEAKSKIKEAFRERAAEDAQDAVAEWKTEKIYPFEGEPKTQLEAIERQVFDIVAVNLQQHSPDLGSAGPNLRALHLRMLRNAIENSPEELQVILSEVMLLPKRKQKELAELLKETTLSAIITASKTVADRLKFLRALELIVFDPDKRDKLKERSQLHQILAANTWIFGEEYNLWVNDKDLKRVLEKHKELLDPNIVIDDPVKVVGQTRGIVDLMFSRQLRRHQATSIENLVVELKAPKVTLSSGEYVQITKYAAAVVNDERFHTVPGIKWDFWLISNQYDDYVKSQVEGGPDPSRNIILDNQDKGLRVGIKTWSELIEENRAKLQFFKQQLEHDVDDGVALEYLRSKHAEFLGGVLDEPDEAEGDDEQDEPN